MIRPADPSEGPALAALHRAAIEAGCAGAYTREQIAAWLAVIEPGAYFAHTVLVAGEEPVGLGVCSPEDGLINAAYVAPQAAGRGVGRALMGAMEALIERPEVRLNATLNAVGFYRTLGYGNEAHALNRLPSGVYLPSVSMSKPLERGL